MCIIALIVTLGIVMILTAPNRRQKKEEQIKQQSVPKETRPLFEQKKDEGAELGEIEFT